MLSLAQWCSSVQLLPVCALLQAVSCHDAVQCRPRATKFSVVWPYEGVLTPYNSCHATFKIQTVPQLPDI